MKTPNKNREVISKGGEVIKFKRRRYNSLQSKIKDAQENTIKKMHTCKNIQ